MDFGQKLRTLGHIEVQRLQQLVEGVSEQVWLSNTFRQDRFGPHGRTRSLIFRYAEPDDPWGHRDLPMGQAWRDLLDPVIRQAAAGYGYEDAGCCSIMIANLPAGQSIDAHRDFGTASEIAHRIHVPLRADAEVDFTIEGEVFHLAEAVAYEVNNTLTHACFNRGKQDRLHLIFDYVDWRKAAGRRPGPAPPGEVKTTS